VQTLSSFIIDCQISRLFEAIITQKERFCWSISNFRYRSENNLVQTIKI